MNFRTLLSATLLAALPVSVYAQGLTEPGYELKGSLPNPAPFSAYTTLQDGTRAHFDGNTVSQHSLDGTFIQNLHVFPTFNFTGCIAADPSGDSAPVVHIVSVGRPVVVKMTTFARKSHHLTTFRSAPPVSKDWLRQ